MNQQIIESALKHGIKLFNKPNFEINGIVTLAYLPQFDDFAICYGTCEKDAGYVLIKDHGISWDIIK